jgi:Zn-dependent M28 family amino/carboxypeptidase
MAELEVAWIRFSGFFSDSLLAVLQWGDGAIRNWANGIVGLWNWLADLLPSIMSKIDEVGANSEWIKSSREVLAANQQAAVDAARAPVAAAKAELDALTAKADAARAKTMKKFEGMKDKAKDLLTMPDFTKTGKADKQQADVIQGTFSPVVASAMASSPVMDAMETVAENTGEANGLLGEIKDKIEGLGMLWE